MNEYENADKKQQDIIDDINDYNKQEIDLEPVYSEEGAEDNINSMKKCYKTYMHFLCD